MKVYTRCEMSKITIGITELHEDLGRGDGIEEPNREPSFSGKCFVMELKILRRRRLRGRDFLNTE